jgi:hypothetical protein
MHVNFGHFLLIWSNTREFRLNTREFWCITREFRSFPPDLA